MNVLSLFSGGGIGENELNEISVKVVCGVEILENRYNFFSKIHNSNIINDEVYQIMQ